MITVDSFKLRIPIEEVEILNPDFFNKDNYRVVNVANGEVVGEDEWKGSVPPIKVYNYVTIRIAIEWQINSHQKNQQFITLMLNSKLLLEDYMQGIHGGSLKKLYSNLMAASEVKHLVHIPYQSFINGEVTDCDYKKDVPQKLHDFKAAIHKLQGIVGRDNPLVNAYLKSDNMGIQFSHRKTRKFVKQPFIKLYSKPIELRSKHPDFLREVLDGNIDEDIVRVEFTIKNKKHWKMYGVVSPTLERIVDLPQETLQKMMQQAIQVYTGEVKKQPKKRASKLKADSVAILDYIEDSINRGISYSEWRYDRKESMKANDVHRNSIKRNLLLYDALYRQYIKGSPEDAKATGAQQFLFEVFGGVFAMEEDD